EEHPRTRAEPGLDLAVDDEADPLVEAERVGVGNHLDLGEPPPPRRLDDIEHQRPTDSSLHALGIDEEVLQLEAICAVERGGKPDDLAVSGNGDACAPL